MFGYALVALAIGIASLVLLYASYGYSVDTKGQVSQNGLVFVSSQPTGSSIVVNDKVVGRTNSKLDLESGTHHLKVIREGYRNWEREVVVDGGDLQRFDYPFLVPNKLNTTTVDSYASKPLFASQSPDKRQVLMAEPSTPDQFTLLAIRNPAAITTSIIKPLEAERSIADGEQTWKPLQWAANNRHVLFEHAFSQAGVASKEYLVVNTARPEDTVNVSRRLGLASTDEVTLFNQKPDQFYVYSPDTKQLRLFDIDSTTPRVQLNDILAYKTYADDTVLYATSRPPSGREFTDQVSIVLQQGSRSTTLRRYLTGDQKFLLDLARYDSEWYVVVGSSSDKGVYIYKNPQTQVLKVASLPTAWRFLKADKPGFVGFSDNARFILAQSGQNVTVYDAENVESFLYTLDDAMDSEQSHLNWMDGHRLIYVSKGQITMLDFDNKNKQSLGTAFADYEPMFTPDFHGLFTVSPLSDGKPSLRLTDLVTE